MRQVTEPLPEDSRKPGADDQAEILGILADLDLLEELLEDLDEAGITTRDEAMALLNDAAEHVGEREAVEGIDVGRMGRTRADSVDPAS